MTKHYDYIAIGGGSAKHYEVRVAVVAVPDAPPAR